MTVAKGFDLRVRQQERVRKAWDDLTHAQRHSAREALALRPESVTPLKWLGMTSADRIAALHQVSAVPEDCGPDIASAPARARMRAVTLSEVDRVSGPEDVEITVGGFAGRRAACVEDVFDRMAIAAVRARKPMLLTDLQVATGRHYRALVERYEAGGVKLSSIEARTGGGGGGGCAADRRLEDARMIGSMRADIGAGAAMVVRRVRPSARGGVGASIILDRTLVDWVCLLDKDLSAVLEAHGWGVFQGSRDRLRMALCGALDRMSVYRRCMSRKGLDA
ncbi:MAG TPA: hypothetical protein VGC40_09085 [Paenirhodobacter sp.]